MAAGRSVVLQASFTTMGELVASPAAESGCPSWFVEQWELDVREDGSYRLEVSDGTRAVLSRNGVIREQKLSEVVRFVAAQIPSETVHLGRLATDSDSGEVIVHGVRGHRSISAEGAYAGSEEFASFYTIVRFLEREFSIPNPYCH